METFDKGFRVGLKRTVSRLNSSFIIYELCDPGQVAWYLWGLVLTLLRQNVDSILPQGYMEFKSFRKPVSVSLSYWDYYCIVSCFIAY